MDLNKQTSYHYAKYMWMHLFVYWLKDSFIIYHSPAWCKKKSEFTLSPNDLNFNENHYFDNYINNVESVFWTEESLIKSIDKILENNNLSVIYIITTDVAEIIWFDVNQVINVLESKYTNTKFIYLSWQAIWWDLFDWYKETLYRTLETYEIKLNKDNNDLSINLFWYFFHRYEWDFNWDLLEFKNILSDLWVKLNIFLPWYSNYSEINNILKSNKSILFKPYIDSESVKILEDKFKQNTTLINLPIWINNTISFIKTLSELFNINVDSYIDKHLSVIIPKINLLEQVLLWKKFWIVGDSQKLLGILDLYMDIWMIPKYIIFTDNNTNAISEVENIFKKYNFLEDVSIHINIERNYIISIINDVDNNIDLLLWSSIEKSNLKVNIKFLEIFFPMITKHYINNYSIIWFSWVLNILTETYNLLNNLEYYNLSNSLGSLMWDFTFYHSKNASK